MKDLFRNKRILFPAIIFLVVIVIAILVLILIGMDTSKGKRVDNVVFDNTPISSTTTNVTNTTNTTNTSNTENATNTDEENNTNTVNNNTSTEENNEKENDDEDNVEFGGEKFYLDTANDFTKALTDEEEMRKFVDNHVDVKAYIACYNNNGDDSKFMDEYNSIDLDDNLRNEVIDIFADLAKYNSAKLTALTDPRQSGDSDAINRVTLTIKTNENTQKIRMVFYQDIVIYIYDENGDSIINFA